MKLKVKEVLSMKEVLQKLIGQDLDTVVSYDVEEIVSSINEELATYNKTKTKLIKKLGKEDKDKKTIVVEKENIEKYNKELVKILEKEVEIKGNKIKVSRLEGSKLNVIEVARIKPILER